MSKKKFTKQRLIKTDEYYNDGVFELAHYGKFVSMRNLSTSKQQEEMIAFYKDEYPKVKKRIDEKIQKRKNEISICFR